FRYYLYIYKCVVGRVDHTTALVVAPSDIVSLAAYRFLPSDTFGIETGARAKNNTFACMILNNILNHRGSLYVHCWDARNPQELVFSKLPDTPVLDNTIDEDPMNTGRDIICDFLYRVSDDSTT
ncbi:hypothetical protein VP01_13986g1, partial [Puccinia sorghi]